MNDFMSTENGELIKFAPGGERPLDTYCIAIIDEDRRASVLMTPDEVRTAIAEMESWLTEREA